VLARFRGQGGASAVEFALVLPLLVVLIFGIFFGAIVYNRQLSITQAAREAARFGATLPFNGTAPDAAWLAAVETRAVNASNGALSAPGATICVRFVADDGATTGPDCGVDASAAANRARVEVAVQRPSVLEFILYSIPVTLRAESVGRFEPEA
jgi:Flp pilus assembly protein TadG